MRKHLQNTGLFLVCLLFCLGVIEGAARIIEPDITFSPDAFPWLKRDAYLGWVNRPGNHDGFQIDVNGNRNTETEVLCLGDSGTFGIHKTNDGVFRFDMWTGRYTNAGVIGYNSLQVLRLLKDDAGAHKTVLVRVGWNDHATEHTARMNESALAPYLRYSAIGRMLMIRATNIPIGTRPFVSPDKFRANIQEIIHTARANGQRLAFVDYPIDTAKGADVMQFCHRGQNLSIDDIGKVHRAYQDIIKAECAANGIDYLRTNPTFSNEDGVHPDRAGMSSMQIAVRRAVERGEQSAIARGN